MFYTCQRKPRTSCFNNEKPDYLDSLLWTLERSDLCALVESPNVAEFCRRPKNERQVTLPVVVPNRPVVEFGVSDPEVGERERCLRAETKTNENVIAVILFLFQEVVVGH